MKFLNKKLIFLPFIFLFLFSMPAAAQFSLPSIRDVKPTIALTSEPITPLSNSTVAITASLSGVIGASDSNYVWFLNGARQAAASGINKNTFTFKTGGVGTIYKISVSVTMPNGENLSDSINLTASDVDLTWIANSQAPVFYRAKLMPIQNSIVALSALPFIYRPGTRTKIPYNNLVYNWIVNDKLDFEKSGLNKPNYIFAVNNFFGNSYLVRLEIKTEDNAVYLNKYAAIPVVKPQVLLYFSDPKTGLPFGVALKNLMIKPINLNFVAQPYFFNAPFKNLKWQWFVNNAVVNPPAGEEKPWLASLDFMDDFFRQFSAQIKVTAQNPRSELESAQSITNLEIK